MREFILYAIVASIPILWIISIYLLRKRKEIYRYFIVHLVLFIAYLYLVLFSNFKFFEYDQLGLKKVFLFIFILLFHTLANFIFALYHTFKLSKNGNKPKSTL